jgi:hypothetical protein
MLLREEELARMQERFPYQRFSKDARTRPNRR